MTPCSSVHKIAVQSRKKTNATARTTPRRSLAYRLIDDEPFEYVMSTSLPGLPGRANLRLHRFAIAAGQRISVLDLRADSLNGRSRASRSSPTSHPTAIGPGNARAMRTIRAEWFDRRLAQCG